MEIKKEYNIYFIEFKKVNSTLDYNYFKKLVRLIYYY